MKTIFDTNTASALIHRINSLPANARARWGKMELYQMLKHCTLSEEMLQGKKAYKRLFIGKLFGGMALRSILKNDSPMKHHQPTHPELKIKETGNWETERRKWIRLLTDYQDFSNDDFIHPFFGKMTRDAIGQFVYKHADHHLRQFGS